ncbi:MAG: carbohydrate binding domain-containing protein [Lentisphaeria bacterium]|nr:carbohydrate binding domain-containing protein [Lentisphaeria bacterium]
MNKLLTMMLALGTAASAAAAGNFGINGTFDKLAPWRSAQQSDGKVTLHKIVKDNGNSCVEVCGDPANPKNTHIILGSQLKGLEPEATYLVSFRYKAKVRGDRNKKLRVRVQQHDTKGKSIAYNDTGYFYDKEGWQNFSFSFKSHKMAYRSYLYIETKNLDTADRVWYDDVTITKVDPADRGFVVNGGFELGIFPWMSHQQGGGWKQLHTTSPDTPFGKKCLEITGDPENSSNRLVILNQKLNGLKIGTPYKLSLQFRSSVKSEPGPTKVAYMRMQQLGPKGEYILGNELHFALNSDLWTYREMTFVPDKRATQFLVYICTGNLKSTDKFYVDEVTVHEAVAPGKPFDAKLAAKTAPAKELKDARGTAKLTAANTLHSLDIDGKVIVPAAENSTQIFAQQGNFEEYLDANGTVGKKLPFKASAEYKWVNGEFRQVVTITATADARGPFKIGLRHGLAEKMWNKQLFGLFPMRVLPAGVDTVFTFNGDINDLNLTQMDLYQGVIMPLQVMEGDDAYLAISSHNYDDTITIRPNIPKGYSAVFERNPLKIKKGDTFRFEVNFKYFDRKENMLRDVWRDQIFALYSNRPELKPYFPVKDPDPRAVISGPMGSVTGMIPYRVNRLFPNSAIWEGWHDVPNEEFPTKGHWWSGSNGWEKPYTAGAFRAHVKNCQDKGLSIIAYMRTFCNLDYAGKRFPADWTRKTSGGGLQLYGGGYRVQLPPHVEKDTGLKEVVWGMFDTFKPGCLDFLIDRFTKVVDFYKPWGIGWDCAGFGPEDFLMVAAMTQKLRTNGYKTKVVGNECTGPINAYLDWTMIENGFFGGKTPYDYEAIRALPLPVACLERFNLANAMVENYLYKKPTWVRPYGKVWSNKYLDFVTAKQPELKQKANQKKLEHHMQMAWYYKDLSLGAPGGYMEECKPIPESMVRMCSEANGIIRVDKSYAIRFANGKEDFKSLTACAWADSKTNKFRLAGFNDAATTEKFVLTLDKAAFAAQGWSMEDIAKNLKAYLADPESEKLITVSTEMKDGNLVISCDLPAYTALLLFADK